MRGNKGPNKIEVGDTLVLKTPFGNRDRIVVEEIQKDDDSEGSWHLFCGQGLGVKRGGIKEIIKSTNNHGGNKE